MPTRSVTADVLSAIALGKLQSRLGRAYLKTTEITRVEAEGSDMLSELGGLSVQARKYLSLVVQTYFFKLLFDDIRVTR